MGERDGAGSGMGGSARWMPFCGMGAALWPQGRALGRLGWALGVWGWKRRGCELSVEIWVKFQRSEWAVRIWVGGKQNKTKTNSNYFSAERIKTKNEKTTVYIYIYIYIYLCTCIYIYIYILLFTHCC